jgi:DNA invertase Pin-like site-specific DNA recombinase
MEKKKIRTCAYCRVSTASDTQDGSFEVQCEYYERLISSDPEMEFVGVYGDHGKSGRKMYNRTELNRMIKDCEDGKIDLILTKSISRFARNMADCVETVRHLKELGVRVLFEKENLDTDTMTGELILGILATIAQEESISLSQNQAWSRMKHLERGETWSPPRYGYTSDGKNHGWVIVPNQAEVVRMAFYMAATCHTYAEIRDEMNRMEREERSEKVWTKPTVALLLRSENYVGDFLSNKECTIIDSNGKEKRVKNKGFVDQILIEGHHPAIVSHELFDIVQELIKHGTIGGGRSVFSAEEKYLMEKGQKIAEKEVKLWEAQR